MARTKTETKNMVQRSVYVPESDFKWLKENRYSLTDVVRDAINDLKNKKQ